MFHSRNAVLDDGIYLPKFLFCSSESNSKSISPAATLNPATAVDDQPFCTSTSPSSSLTKKALIIDQDSLEIYESYGERIALLKRLQLAGFKIFLRSAPTAENPSVFHELDYDLRNASLLHNLSQFDKTKDYNELAKQGVARDKSLLLGKENSRIHIGEIKKAFYQNGFSGPLSGNNLRCEFRSFSDEEWEEIGKKIRDKYFPERKFRFYFNKGTPEQRMALCSLEGRDYHNITKYYLLDLTAEAFAKELSLEKLGLDLLPILMRIAPDKAEVLVGDLFELKCGLEYQVKNLNFLIENVPDKKEYFFNIFKAKIGLVKLSDFQLKAVRAIFDIYEGGAENFFSNNSLGSNFMRLDKREIDQDSFHAILGALNLADDLPEEFLEKLAEVEEGDPLIYASIHLHLEKILEICQKNYPKSVPSLMERLLFESVSPEKHEYLIREFIREFVEFNLGVSSLIMEDCLSSEVMVQINEGLMDGEALNSLSLEEFLSANNPSATTPKPTYLDIVGLNSENKTSTLFEKSEAGDFANVATIRFGNYDDQSEGGKIQANQIAEVIRRISLNTESKNELGGALKHIILPEISRENEQINAALKALDGKISYEFFDYENYLGIVSILREKREEIEEIEEIEEAASASKTNTSEFSTLPPSKQKNEIFIAEGRVGDELKVENSGGEINSLALAGEVLNNNDIQAQIRTEVLERDIAQNLLQKAYLPSKFSSITKLESLTEEQIEGFRKTNPSQIYCQFNLPLTANEKFRLPSFSASETLVGILGSVDNLKIERGDDDFFYATSEVNRTLSYVVQADHPKSDIESYCRLSSDDPIKKIIDDYRDPQKGFVGLAVGEKCDVEYDPEFHQASMKKMFDDRSGVCRHRVAAVEYELISKGIDRQRFRTVGINGNHVVLEIKTNGKWIKVDFGGGAALETKKVTNYESEPVLNQKPTQSAEEEIVLEKKSPLKSIFKTLLDIKKLDKVENAEDLKTKTTHSDNDKILIVSKKIEDHANFLLHEAIQEKREVFYIDNPNKIDLHRTNLLIANDNSPFLSAEGLLSKFLENVKNPQTKKPLLVINWDAFDNKQKVALNSVLDPNGSINGEKIDGPIQIIGFSSKASQDPSFLSRHNLSLESEIDLPVLETINSEEKTLIDLQGFSNWRRFLFGKIVLVEDKMQWQKSDFVQALERGENNFAVTNLSKQAAQELKKEFAQAKALGKFTYHGYNIDLPESTQITYKSNSFDFIKFSDATKISVANGVTLDQVPLDAKLINSQLFDFLLCDKEIKNSHYNETTGFIENAKDQTLKLFISSDLSESQWYCLFNESQKHNVQLELHLAPQVKVPANVKSANLAENESENLSNIAQIFLTNDCKKTLEGILKDGEEYKGEATEFFAVVDVEDCAYQDLIEKITFKTTASGFIDFEKSESELLTKLQEGKKIVLRGQFAPDLLQMLEPILTSEIGKNLTLIIENKGLAPDELKWLAPSKYAIERHNEMPALFTEITYFETPDTSYDLENSEEKAKTFIATRKESLLQTLRINSMVRLTGHSGVGKSSLIRELEKESETTIYRELANIEAWANNRSDEIKILFIDESNIEDRHFTAFSPLKNGGGQRIFYQGKFYDLDENHKVVFAHNELEYGGGRLRQKIFDDGKIPALLLRDFPASYIYEKVLKEAIFNNLQSEKTNISESDFKNICRDLIANYQQINSVTKDTEANPETVRELQNKVLVAISERLHEPQQSIESKNFISTSATKEVERALGAALNIKLGQKLGYFPQQSVGLNGVLIEGDSGTGKSELIAAMLASKEITEIKIGEISDSQKQRFYKIDANLPLEQKKEIIVKAFENGDIVWIDEINSCIDDGLEKILNAALTGDHPDGKKDAPKPGFMLISSVNSAGLEGRSLISPALLHRTIQPSVKSLKEYSQDDLSKIVEHWLKPELKEINGELITDISKNIAQDFRNCLHAKGGENLNLRMLRGALNQVLPVYVQNLSEEIASVLLEKVDILKLVNRSSYLDRYDPEIAEQISSNYDKLSELQRKLISDSGDNFESCLSEVIQKRYEAVLKPSGNLQQSEGASVLVNITNSQKPHSLG